jgi:hypothetical protein
MYEQVELANGWGHARELTGSERERMELSDEGSNDGSGSLEAQRLDQHRNADITLRVDVAELDLPGGRDPPR